MLTGVQQVILTCLLGPEDTGAFKRSQAVDRVKRWRTEVYTPENPRPYTDNDRERAATYYVDNRETLIDYAKWFRLTYPDTVRESSRKCNLNRRRTNPTFRLSSNIRSRIRGALKRAIAKKGSKTFHLVGCHATELMKHLESLFKPGMTWENYGPVWHVDHIKPCAAFDLTDPDQQSACFHWTNLQPLFALENIKKGDKYDIGK